MRILRTITRIFSKADKKKKEEEERKRRERERQKKKNQGKKPVVLPIKDKDRDKPVLPPTPNPPPVGETETVFIPVVRDKPVQVPYPYNYQVPTLVNVDVPVNVPYPSPIYVDVPVATPVPVYIGGGSPVFVEQESNIQPSNVSLAYSGDVDLGVPLAEYNADWLFTNSVGDAPEAGSLINVWNDLIGGNDLTAGTGQEGVFGIDSDSLPFVRFQAGDGMLNSNFASQLSGNVKPYTIALVFSLNSVGVDQRFCQLGVNLTGNASVSIGTNTSLNADNQPVLAGRFVDDSATARSFGLSSGGQSQVIFETGRRYCVIMTSNGTNAWIYASTAKGYPRLLGSTQDGHNRTLSKFSLGCGINTSGARAFHGDINIYHCAVWNKSLYTPIELFVQLSNTWKLDMSSVPKARIAKRPTFSYVFRPMSQFHNETRNSGQNFYEIGASGSGNYFTGASVEYTGDEDTDGASAGRGCITWDGVDSTARLQIDSANSDFRWRVNSVTSRWMAFRVRTSSSFTGRNRAILCSGSSASDHFRLYFNQSANLVFEYANSSGFTSVTSSEVFATNTWYVVYAGFDGQSTIWIRQNMRDKTQTTDSNLGTPAITTARDIKIFNDSGGNTWMNEGRLHWLHYWYDHVPSEEDINIVQTARFHAGLGGGIQSSSPAEFV
jgi:hypothetical protein